MNFPSNAEEHVVRKLTTLIVITLLTLTSATAQQAAWVDSLNRHLTFAASFDLTAKAWSPLTLALNKADWVLIGEEHGSREIPEFCKALTSYIKPSHTIIEVDPYTATELNRLSLLPHSETKASLQKRSFNYSFYGTDAEFDFLKHVTGNGSALTGLDQVSLLSTPLFFELLSRVSTTSTGKQEVLRHFHQSMETDKKAISTGSLETMYLLSIKQSELDVLKSTLGKEPIAKEMLEAFTTSRQIYTDQANGHFLRISMMKRNVLALYQQQLKNSNRKVFFKFGAMHMAKTGSFFGNDDIGSLASNLADTEGKTTLHILTLIKQGQANTFMPSLQEDVIRSFNSSEKQSHLQALAPLFKLQNSDSILIADLRPLKKLWAKGSITLDAGILRTIINGYDFLVVLPHAEPSRYIR